MILYSDRNYLIQHREDQVFEVQQYKVPGNWAATMPRPQVEKVELTSDFCSRTTFKKSNQGEAYIYHSLPSGAVPVSLDKDRKRIHNGYTFDYNGMEVEAKKNIDLRNVDMSKDSFSKERHECLDKNILKGLSISKQRMENSIIHFIYNSSFLFAM